MTYLSCQSLKMCTALGQTAHAKLKCGSEAITFRQKVAVYVHRSGIKRSNHHNTPGQHGVTNTSRRLTDISEAI